VLALALGFGPARAVDLKLQLRRPAPQHRLQAVVHHVTGPAPAPDRVVHFHIEAANGASIPQARGVP
jgi:hypothetical protein